jgi:hypothetical protein
MMKLQIALLAVVFCLVILGLSCEEFRLGAFLYNRNYENEAYHRNYSSAMQEAGYNTAVCTAMYNVNGVANMLGIMNEYGIEGIVEDFLFDPATSTYGAKTLSTGNYYRYEAEYCDDDTLNILDTSTADNFYYMSPNADYARVGIDSSSTSFSNHSYWHINQGQSGYAYHDLMFKWPVADNLTKYRRVGNEFRFPLSPADGGGQTGSYDLFATNVLYITFALKCTNIDSLADNTVLAKISLNCKGEYNDSPYTPITIPHDFETNTLCDTTYVTKQMYQSCPVDPDYSFNRLITVSIPVPRLNSYGVLGKGPNFTKALININPHLYWNGYGVLMLDYIDIQDRMFRDYTNQNAVLSQIRTFNLPYVLGYDEPTPAQFRSFEIISRYWETNGINTQLIAPVHKYVNVVKTSNNNEPYKHRKAYIESVDPKSFVMDEYPFDAAKQVNWTNVDSQFFVQNYLSKLCDEYNMYKNLCLEKDIDFIIVPQTCGNWTNSNNGYWRFLYPPDKVMKSLQLLPLCFQANGIIDFEFGGMLGESLYFGIMPIDNTSQYHKPAQFYAIKEANKKIKTYGKLLTSEGFQWLGSVSLMTSSPSFNVSSVLLDSLYVPYIPNSSLYQGWVQAGFFVEDTFPYVMLVNRRGIVTQQNPPFS